MPYQNDMSTLADVVSPAYAAQQAGIQNDAANQEAQTKLGILQQQAPALAQQPGLENLYKQAQTGLTQGQGMAAQAKGIQDLALLPGGIQLGQTKQATEITQAHVQQMGQLGQLVGQVAGVMDNVPAPARPAAMAQILKQNGIDANSVGPLASGDPQVLRDISSKMIGASGEFQKMVAEQNLRGNTERDVANIHGQYSRENAQILAQGRENVAGINAQARMAGIQQVIGQLTKKVADGTATDDDRRTLAYANQTQQMIRSGNPMASQLLGLNTESNVPAVPGGGAMPQQPQVPQTGGAPSQPQSGGEDAVTAEMRKRGLLK